MGSWNGRNAPGSGRVSACLRGRSQGCAAAGPHRLARGPCVSRFTGQVATILLAENDDKSGPTAGEIKAALTPPPGNTGYPYDLRHPSAE
jgi:hypothetical protein